MIHYTEHVIIDGIRNRNNKVLMYVYKQFYPPVKHMVNNNSGGDEDAEDVFQEAIIIIFDKLAKNELKLSCAMKTYIYSICRNLWLQKLNKAKRLTSTDLLEFSIADEVVDVEQSFEEYDKDQLYQQHFIKLSEQCQKLLRMFLDKIGFREITIAMGFKSEEYARKIKQRCKDTLLENIQNDSRYQLITND